MCQAFSSVVMRPHGDEPLRTLRSLYTDHHDILIAEAGVKEIAAMTPVKVGVKLRSMKQEL